jgi:hypothetical protein
VTCDIPTRAPAIHQTNAKIALDLTAEIAYLTRALKARPCTVKGRRSRSRAQASTPPADELLPRRDQRLEFDVDEVNRSRQKQHRCSDLMWT